MRRFAAAAFVFLFWAIALAPGPSSAQQDNPQSDRKVVKRVIPSYPELARSMNLKGSVRVDALVAPNGTVRSVQVRGGHPVLAEAAEKAIRKWKWQPAAHETSEPVEVKFNPQ